MTTRDNDNKLFEDNLETIQKAIDYVCRRQCLYGDEADEFASTVFVRLLDERCKVLRKHKRDCRLKTYVSVVVLNIGRDYRNAKWGRWRNSAASRRLGTTAMRLETLRARDGYSLREAGEILTRHHRVSLTLSQLADLEARLPHRMTTWVETKSDWEDVPGQRSAEEGLARAELDELRSESKTKLDRALAILEPEDRLIMKMRFEEGLKVVAISRALGLDAQPTYGRIQRNLKRLRSELGANSLRSCAA